MAELTCVRAQIREALQHPDHTIRKFLTALYDANDFVTLGDLEKITGFDRRFIGSTKGQITKRLLKVRGPLTNAENLLYKRNEGDVCLRPEFWTVIGEVLGRRQEVRVSGMKIVIRSVERTSADQATTVNFGIFGLTIDGRVLPVSVIVPGRSGNTLQAVQQGCDILQVQLTELARSAESLKEDLSQWD